MNHKRQYGALGRICIVGGAPAVSDFHRWLHPDISIVSAPMPLKSLSPEGLLEMGRKLPAMFSIFKEYVPADYAFFSCTSGSLIGGPGYDEELARIINEAAGTKEACTTTTAVLEAMQALGTKQMSIVTPYPDDVNEPERVFFEDKGYVIHNIDGMKTADPRNNKLIWQIPPETIYDFAIEHMDPRSDTLFISCTGLQAIQVIAALEKRLSVPVVTSNQSAVWRMGKFVGAHSPEALENLGQLFRI